VGAGALSHCEVISPPASNLETLHPFEVPDVPRCDGEIARQGRCRDESVLDPDRVAPSFQLREKLPSSYRLRFSQLQNPHARKDLTPDALPENRSVCMPRCPKPQLHHADRRREEGLSRHRSRAFQDERGGMLLGQDGWTGARASSHRRLFGRHLTRYTVPRDVLRSRWVESPRVARSRDDDFRAGGPRRFLGGPVLAELVELDAHHARSGDAQRTSRAQGEIDAATFHEGSAIGDRHDDVALVT
jgi:hypothetical protein